MSDETKRMFFEARRTRERLSVVGSVMTVGAFDQARLAYEAIKSARASIQQVLDAGRANDEASVVLRELERDLFESHASLMGAINMWESFVNMPDDDDDNDEEDKS